jgi:3-oxoacyl-(acyl-carrier-protein) synthase
VIFSESGISPIDSFDISPFATTFGGVIRNFDISEYIPAKDAKRMDGFIHYAIAAGCQAHISITIFNQARSITNIVCAGSTGSHNRKIRTL